MTPTLYVARIDGATRPIHLSLHTSYEGAVSAVLRAGGAAYRGRFDYIPEDLRPLTERAAQEYGLTAAAALRKAEDRLTGVSWRASVEELPVELDGAEDAPEGVPSLPAEHWQRMDAERAGHPADATVAEADATL